MGSRVYLNVYDLTTQMNSWTYWCGVGVFHAGVEVYGIEYAYGGECPSVVCPGQHVVCTPLSPSESMPLPCVQGMTTMCLGCLPRGHGKRQEQVRAQGGRA